MRYLLRRGNQSEIPARITYLKQTFQLWFVAKETIGTFVVLESIPSTVEKEICIIYGHNNEVASLFKNHNYSISENNIFVIACLTNNPKDFILSNKHVYIAPQNRYEGVKLRKGTEYGFDFDISDVELNLFNNNTQKSHFDKLTSVFSEYTLE